MSSLINIEISNKSAVEIQAPHNMQRGEEEEGEEGQGVGSLSVNTLCCVPPTRVLSVRACQCVGAYEKLSIPSILTLIYT